jgi:hypothetical protein
MSDIPPNRELSKAQLAHEIAQVEKIISLAEDATHLDEANRLAEDFLKSYPSDAFDAIGLNEYLAYLLDMRRYLAKNNTAAAKEAKKSGEEFLSDALRELHAAKQKLQHL